VGRKVGCTLSESKKAISQRFISKTIKENEFVMFFPSLAYQTETGKYWIVEIHGWIYKRTKFSKKLPFIDKLLESVNLKPIKKYENLYKERVSWFFVDNKGRKKLSIVFNHKKYILDTSANNGHFYAKLKLSMKEVQELEFDDFKRASFFAVTDNGDERLFAGKVHFVEPKGISIISDIDDTIKLSEVEDKKKLLKNTFLKPYQSIPGMSSSYRQWSNNQEMSIHYLTSSPWQLYHPLSQFLSKARFPAGSFHMKYFRWKDKTFLNIFKSSEKYKLDVIRDLLKKYPRRTFILIGDSGEHDIAIYAAIANEYPNQIRVIYIRDTGSKLIPSRQGNQIVELTKSCYIFLFKSKAQAENLHKRKRR